MSNGDLKIHMIEPGAIAALGDAPALATTSATKLTRVDLRRPEVQSEDPVLATATMRYWFPEPPAPGGREPETEPAQQRPEPERAKWFDRLSHMAAKVLPIFAVLAPTTVVLIVSFYYIDWRTRWIVSLQTHGANAPHFELKCNLLEMQASLTGDDRLQEQLAAFRCPGAYSSGRPLEPARTSSRPFHIATPGPHENADSAER
ncbi:hypothetical protein [Roseinatronobacter monicus]|uniref:Uncharacterized protein n=1 Tax=Roseinatronobacter monicus TaxID=393481 RepID=A0A543K4I3_9RHOB|nr:hypothetical protein [Roseinatronobacter monicus]TQM89944.1 hypothetical protein BD293_4262 [Roseinatronobacter monicus]